MTEQKTKPALTLDSLADICRHMSISLGSEYGDTDGYFFSEGFPRLGWHNRVILNEMKEFNPQLLDAAIKLAHSGHHKFLTFCDELVPAEAVPYIESRNMKLNMTLSGMLCYPMENDPDFHDDRIIEVFEDRIDEWEETLHEAFGSKGGSSSGRPLLKDKTVRIFAVEEEHRIVSTVKLCLDENGVNAGVHNVGTLPTYRGRGYAEALVRHTVACARKEGFPMLSLQATDRGRRVYEKIGFRKESTIRMYQ